MKRILCILCLLCFCLLLCSCSSSSSDLSNASFSSDAALLEVDLAQSGDADMNDLPSSGDAVLAEGDLAQSEGVDMNDLPSSGDAALSEGELAQSGGVDINKVRYYAQEPDGYTWIFFDGRYQCVSVDGTVVSFPEDIPQTYVYRGFSIASNPDEGTKSLINIKGDTILSLTSWNEDFFHWDENNPLADGLILAIRVTESYSGVTYEFGTLNTAGEWIEPISTRHPMLECGLEFDLQTPIEKQIVYAGEGIFLFKLGSKAYGETGLLSGIYDAYSNKAYPYDSRGWSSFSMIEMGLRFKNDRAILLSHPSSFAPRLEVLTRNGFMDTSIELPSEMLDYEIDHRTAINEDYFFTMTHNETCTLWNRDGKMIKNFEGLSIWPYGTFVNGLAPAIIRNDLGTLYFTLLRTDGSFLFEPVNIPNHTYKRPARDYNDNILSFDGKYTLLRGKDNYYVYDDKGEQVNSFPLDCYYGPYQILGQNNGVFCIRLKKGLYDYTTGIQITDDLCDYITATEKPAYQ